jgi:hypothetical protein
MKTFVMILLLWLVVFVPKDATIMVVCDEEIKACNFGMVVLVAENQKEIDKGNGMPCLMPRDLILKMIEDQKKETPKVQL